MNQLYYFRLWPTMLLAGGFLLLQLAAQAQLTPQNMELITTFKQGPGGRNCASISVIKLAIGQYGEGKVLKQIDVLPTEYHVTLQDDSSLILTKAELTTASALDHFGPAANANQAMYRTAEFLFAVMAKKKFLAAKRKSPIEYHAIDDVIMKGGVLAENTIDNFLYLGLEHNYDSLTVADAAAMAAVIVTNRYHSAYGAKGSYDEYGTVAPFSEFCSHRNKWKGQICKSYQIATCYSLR